MPEWRMCSERVGSGNAKGWEGNENNVAGAGFIVGMTRSAKGLEEDGVGWERRGKTGRGDARDVWFGKGLGSERR